MSEENDPKSKVCNIIRSNRRAARIKQRELADMIGVHQFQVSRWEQGLVKPSAESLFKIAEALGKELIMEDKQEQL